MKTARKKNRRCNIKIMTKEAAVLKHLRESRKLSMKKAGKIMGISDSWVSHAENGRSDLDPKMILMFLNTYGYTYEEFMGLVKGNIPMPANTYAECIEILKRLDKEKLNTVKAILQSF